MIERLGYGALLAAATFLTFALPGGTFLVALLLVPVHWLVARDARSAIGRWFWAAVAATAVAVNAWGIAYLATGEPGPAAWALPPVTGVATLLLVERTARRPAPAPPRGS